MAASVLKPAMSRASGCALGMLTSGLLAMISAKIRIKRMGLYWGGTALAASLPPEGDSDGDRHDGEGDEDGAEDNGAV